jgi:TPR repeat protein
MYSKGDGVKLDKKKAMQLIRRASEKNHAHAQYLLSRELDAEFVAYADAEVAKLHAKPASERQAGDEDALVTRLEANQESSSKEVYRYARLSAEQGFIPAMRSLGLCYIQGHGVERDVDEARRWLERAAATGDAGSIAELEKLNA